MVSKTQTSNPEEKTVNQKQGPRTGNAGNAEKRDAFIRAKSGGEKQALADLVTNALETRGRGQQPNILPATENLESNRGPKTNPTANGSRLSKGAKRPQQTKG